MSQMAVVHYNSSEQSINILNNTDINSKNGERKIIVLRKHPAILPQPQNFVKNDVLLTNPGRKSFKKSNTTDSKPQQQPTAVARRNARERNRVKQVNNGFANLRQRIPSFIAQAYESNNGRTGNKKLSKVETLRMAVEYIRSLEEILAMDGDENMINIRNDASNNSESDLSYSIIMSPSEDDDEMSTVSSSSPQQYIRINQTNNTYEIISTNMLDNSENLDPMVIHDTMLTDSTDLDFNEEFSYLHSNVQTNRSLSPEVYSEGSLSPAESKVIVQNQNCFIPVFEAAKFSANFNVHIKTEKDSPVISLKTEQDIPGSQKEFSEVMNWWESNSHASVGS